MEWRRHTDSVPQALQELLGAYPFKTFQQQFLGLSSSDLAAYQYEAFQKTDLAVNPFFTLEGAGQCDACFGLVHHSWHSELFGVRIYRLAHLLLREHSPALCREVTAKVVEEAKALSADLLTVRLDCEELQMQQALTAEGFFNVGQSVKLAQTKTRLRLDTSLPEGNTSANSRSSAAVIRRFVRTDLEALLQVASASHRYSHFFNDPRLAGRGIERLFPAWVEKCCRGLAAAVLVAERSGGVLGFATLLLNEGLARHTGKQGGVVDFIAVAPEAQGQGIGKQLLAASLKWLCERADYIEVRTELANFPAIHLYQAFGLELVSADVVLHRWMD